MAYSANGNYTDNSGRVRYRIEYDSDNDLYRLPKAPELIKIAHSVAADVFYDSSNDYEPEWVDISLLSEDYSQQIFFDVTNEKNMIFVDTAVTGDCLTNVYEFINYTP